MEQDNKAGRDNKRAGQDNRQAGRQVDGMNLCLSNCKSMFVCVIIHGVYLSVCGAQKIATFHQQHLLQKSGKVWLSSEQERAHSASERAHSQFLESTQSIKPLSSLELILLIFIMFHQK